MRRIDNSVYYDWPKTIKIVRELMPNAIMFSDSGPDTRWVGNERGMAGETCWETLDMTAPAASPVEAPPASTPASAREPPGYRPSATCPSAPVGSITKRKTPASKPLLNSSISTTSRSATGRT